VRSDPTIIQRVCGVAPTAMAASRLPKEALQKNRFPAEPTDECKR